MPAIYDALIIGGGPAGATAAFLLAEAGWRVAVIEKKTFPRGKVCGEFISATNLPLLQKLGLKEYYDTYGGPEIRRAGIFINDTIIMASMPQLPESLQHWGRALERKYLDNALLDKAIDSGAECWQPWEVKKIEKKGNLYISTLLSNNRIITLAAPLIVMANGSWEKNIELAPISAHKPSDLLAFKRHFSHSRLDLDLMPLLAFPGGYGGLVHTSKNRVTLSCCIRRENLQDLRIKYPSLSAGESLLKHIYSTCLGVKQTLENAVPHDKWYAAGPIRPGIRQCCKDRIFYVGNTAGEAHPIIAEGISMAMQSAWLLTRNLLANQNSISADKIINKIGKHYTKQWHSYFARRIHVAGILSCIAMRPKIAAIIVPLLKKFPHILTTGAKWSGKIKLIAIERENTI